MNAYHALAASYDRLTNDVDYGSTVDFYMQILEREGISPRTVVDLACGTGSVTKILAQKGYDVTGVDMSEEMLTQAHQKVQDMDTPPRFIFRKLQVLYLPFGMLLTKDEEYMHLERIYLDMFNAYHRSKYAFWHRTDVE